MEVIMQPYYEQVKFNQPVLPILIYKLISDDDDITYVRRINITNHHETEYFDMTKCREISHWHNSLEILYYFEDGAGMIINGDYFAPNNEDILLIDSFDIHKDPDDKLDGHYVFLIDPSLLPVHTTTKIRFPQSNQHKWLQKDGQYETYRSSIVDGLNKILELFAPKQDRNEPNFYEVYGEMFLLLAKLEDYMKTIDTTYTEDQTDTKQREVLKKTYSYVALNFEREITLGEISNLVGFSENYFCRFLKNATNQTFLEFLNSYRCQIASNRMEHSESSITTIALEVGFASVSYFSKVFKKTYGISPSQFRKSVIK